jgi:HAD superfamily hydrolase (TIGR01509 family)
VAGSTSHSGVIFDCDGVLVDSEPVSARVASDVLTGFGFPISPEEAHRRFTGHAMGVQRQWVASLGGSLHDGYERDYEAALVDRYQLELEARPGARELVEAVVSRGIPTCVASNGNAATTLGALEGVGFRGLFEGRVFTTEDVEHGKPAPDLFLLAAARLGVEPGRCLVLEDSPPGIAAGLAAGMTVWALVGTYPREALGDASRVFDSLEAVSAALGFGPGELQEEP